MAEAAKKRDGSTGLKDHVDFGGSKFERGALYLFDCFAQAFDGDIVEQSAGFNEADALRHGAAPFFTADGLGGRGNAADLCAPTVHGLYGNRMIFPVDRRDSISR